MLFTELVQNYSVIFNCHLKVGRLNHINETHYCTASSQYVQYEHLNNLRFCFGQCS